MAKAPFLELATHHFVPLFDLAVELFDGPEKLPSLGHDVIDGVGVEADQGLGVAVDAEDLKEGDQEVKNDLFSVSGSGPSGQSWDNILVMAS